MGNADVIRRDVTVSLGDNTPSNGHGREPEFSAAVFPQESGAQQTILITGGMDDDCRVLSQVLRDWKLDVLHCSNAEEAIRILSERPVLLVFCDLRSGEAGFDGLLQIIGLNAGSRVVAIVPECMGDGVYRAVMQMGAFNVIASPCRRSDVQWSIIFAFRHLADRAEEGPIEL
jgi:DNA-binding NtrC family response regulator